jgi:undecaprenyl-diphosphatase
MYTLCYNFFIQLDHKLFFSINQWHHPWVDRLVCYVTSTCFWIPLYVVLLVLIVITFRRQAWQPLLITVGLLIICDQFASSLVKPWVQRLRPCWHADWGDMVHVVGQYHGVYGFISSHAANTFGIATFLWLLLRKKYPVIQWLFLWAFVVSYARVYGGVHYPLDVILGAVSGVGWAHMVFRCYLRLARLCSKTSKL